MDLWQMFLGQIADPFRIALLVGLLLTLRNTRAVSGVVIPLAAGIVFVAALIPMTLARGAAFLPVFLTGLVANALILAVLGAILLALRRAGRG